MGVEGVGSVLLAVRANSLSPIKHTMSRGPNKASLLWGWIKRRIKCKCACDVDADGQDDVVMGWDGNDVSYDVTAAQGNPRGAVSK